MLLLITTATPTAAEKYRFELLNRFLNSSFLGRLDLSCSFQAQRSKFCARERQMVLLRTPGKKLSYCRKFASRSSEFALSVPVSFLAASHTDYSLILAFSLSFQLTLSLVRSFEPLCDVTVQIADSKGKVYTIDCTEIDVRAANFSESALSTRTTFPLQLLFNFFSLFFGMHAFVTFVVPLYGSDDSLLLLFSSAR